MTSATKTVMKIAAFADATVRDYASALSDITPPPFDFRGHSFITADNLFSRLLPKKYLEDFHTTMLAYFFDYVPNNHQSPILLETFLHFLASNYHSLQAITPQFAGGFEVQQEAHSDGFIDILLTNPKANLAIIIENKIRASDQGRQLPRYYWDLTNNRNYRNVASIYLSLDGHEPDTGDWTEDDLASVHPVCISYGSLVGEWLEPAITRDELQPIHTLLTWYCQVIKQLREVPIMTNMLQEFSAELAENPKTLKLISDIVTERKAIEQALCVSFHEKLVSRLTESGRFPPETFVHDGAHYVRFSLTDRIDYMLSFEENQYSYGIEFTRQDSTPDERSTCADILPEDGTETWTKGGFDTVFVYATKIDLADHELHKIFEPQSLDEEVKRIHTDVQKFMDAFGG